MYTSDGCRGGGVGCRDGVKGPAVVNTSGSSEPRDPVIGIPKMTPSHRKMKNIPKQNEKPTQFISHWLLGVRFKECSQQGTCLPLQAAQAWPGLTAGVGLHKGWGGGRGVEQAKSKEI